MEHLFGPTKQKKLSHYCATSLPDLLVAKNSILSDLPPLTHFVRPGNGTNMGCPVRNRTRLLSAPEWNVLAASPVKSQCYTSASLRCLVAGQAARSVPWKSMTS